MYKIVFSDSMKEVCKSNRAKNIGQALNIIDFYRSKDAKKNKEISYKIVEIK